MFLNRLITILATTFIGKFLAVEVVVAKKGSPRSLTLFQLGTLQCVQLTMAYTIFFF
jgi:hypothetical protein